MTQAPPNASWRSTWIAVAIAFALLFTAAGASFSVWGDIGHVDIPIIGWVGLACGVLLTLVVGIGLMSLVFFSSRHGYDEQKRDGG